MGAEGTVAIVAGVLAGSIALVGFGIDSAIEGFASAFEAVLGPITGEPLCCCLRGGLALELGCASGRHLIRRTRS
jgi:hypothetical protein